MLTQRSAGYGGINYSNCFTELARHFDFFRAADDLQVTFNKTTKSLARSAYGEDESIHSKSARQRYKASCQRLLVNGGTSQQQNADLLSATIKSSVEEPVVTAPPAQPPIEITKVSPMKRIQRPKSSETLSCPLRSLVKDNDV